MTPQLAGKPGGILFIGEAPADEEMVKGFPLVGASGFLLHHALRAARLTDPSSPFPRAWAGQRPETRRLLWERREHSFTNVCDWQFPTKESQPWKLVRPEDLERLKGEIEQCKPNLIVPLGGTALWSLTGNGAIDTYRGAVGVTTRIVPGLKILPTYHPAHILRTYKLLVPFISDLVKAAREAKFPEVRLEPVEIWLDPTLDDLREWRRLYLGEGYRGPLSVDIETGGGQISCVGLAADANRALIVPFVDYRQPDRSYWPTEGDEVAAWEFLIEVLGDTKIEKLFQNGGAFDICWFLDQMGVEVRNYRHDLRLVHKALWPELPASLKFMGASHANIHAWKAGVSHQGEEKRDA